MQRILLYPGLRLISGLGEFDRLNKMDFKTSPQVKRSVLKDTRQTGTPTSRISPIVSCATTKARHGNHAHCGQFTFSIAKKKVVGSSRSTLSEANGHKGILNESHRLLKPLRTRVFEIAVAPTMRFHVG